MENLAISNEKKKVLKKTRFLNEFYQYLNDNTNLMKPKESLSLQYKETVLSLLEDAKAKFPLDMKELESLQMEIENLTFQFDDQSIYKTAPIIINKLIRTDLPCAKDYLRHRLEKEDRELLAEFGPHTIEALIVHVLSMLYSSQAENTIIRVASLVEELESNVRLHGYILNRRRCKLPYSMKDVEEMMGGKKFTYPIGTRLVNFMEERELISLHNEIRGEVRVRMKKGFYYIPSHLYAQCNFDLALLPIKLNLPMVCPPLDWKSALPVGQIPVSLTDLSGGYLSSLSGELYNRYRLLSTGNINHFHIHINGSDYEKLCSVMNKLQGQAFQINSFFLNYIKEEEESLVKCGLLLPRFLASLNMKDVSHLLRKFYMDDSEIKSYCSYPELINTLCKQIQQSRYESFLIKLASAYEGYHFYLPAFLDFRGRIYRSGILHYHERDLARSLIVFADSQSRDRQYGDTEISINRGKFIAATAYHYKSFVSIKGAYDWFLYEYLNDANNLSLEKVREAKHPLQFLANLKGLEANLPYKYENYIRFIPITQDASASAYQIMSYFLLDESLAKRTNLIPSFDGEIQDVYSFILEELKVFMKAELEDNNLSTIVCDHLTRKLVKKIFMPIIYGKTIMSTVRDLKDQLSHYITHKECGEVAKVCFRFWKTKYHGMECLIRLIGLIGGFVSARGSAVFYKVPQFITEQDYQKMVPINIWVTNQQQHKKHRVTFRVPTSKRDCRKTERSTFVNFIHQRDASIAMKVVEGMLEMNAPIYTIHDNFLTTVEYSELIPTIYTNVFIEMGPPLSILNEFIYMNVIEPFVKSDGPPKGYFINKVISNETLTDYLRRNVPENISKKMLATWERKISGILTTYKNYIHIVCGNLESPEDSWCDHLDKWEKFKSQLCKKSAEGQRFSVHY